MKDALRLQPTVVLPHPIPKTLQQILKNKFYLRNYLLRLQIKINPTPTPHPTINAPLKNHRSMVAG